MANYRVPVLESFEFQQPVEDKDLTAPPGGEVKGDRYIVGSSATGDWSGHDDDIAYYDGAAWQFDTPSEGWMCWVKDEDEFYIYGGASWAIFSSGGATTFLGLTDTPGNYTGDANKFVRVNPSENGLEFSTVVETDLPSGIDSVKIADGSVNDEEFQYLDGVTSDIQTQLDAKPDTFLELDDTPGSYVGEANKLVRVNPSENALEFIDPSEEETDTLDTVCDRGAITDKSISIQNLTLNKDALDQDAVITFNKPTSGSHTLRWDKTEDRFEFSDGLWVGGDFFCDWDILAVSLILNYKFLNVDSDILFRQNVSGFEFFRWDMSEGLFRLSNDLQVLGDDLYIGDLTSDNNKIIYANNGDANLPNLRYNESTNKWQYSNDGTSWSDIGSGGAGVQSVEFSVAGITLADGTAGSAAPGLSLVTTSDADDPQCRTFCLRFDDTTDEHIFWQHRLRTNYVSGGRLIVQFYNVSIQADDDNTAQFEGCLQAVTPGDATTMTALDITNDGGGWVGTLKTLTAGTSVARLYEVSIDMTSNLDGMAAGDFIQFGLRRDVSDDDGTGDMAVVSISFEYNY